MQAVRVEKSFRISHMPPVGTSRTMSTLSTEGATEKLKPNLQFEDPAGSRNTGREEQLARRVAVPRESPRCVEFLARIPAYDRLGVVYWRLSALRACGAVGSALPWHGRGREFESHQVHQNVS